MGDIKTVIHPSGAKITFDEDLHKYTDDKGNGYRSVTRVIHDLFPEFESDKMSFFVARKRLMKTGNYSDPKNIPVPLIMEEKKVVLKEWDDNRIQSCDMGTQVHRFCECMLMGIPFDMEITSDRGKKIAATAERFLKELSNSYEFIESEKIIFDPDTLLAGTIDLIMKNKHTGNLCVFDHKTNKQINTSDSYGGKGKLFLSHLDNCNYNVYTLQLSLYKKLLNTQGYGSYDGELGIFHYNTRDTKPYLLNYLEHESTLILDYTKSLPPVVHESDSKDVEDFE